MARCRRLVVSDRFARDSQIVHRLQGHDIRRGEENAKYSTAEKASEYRGNLINIERRITPYRKVNEETEFKKLWQLQNLSILKNFNLKVPKDQQKVVRYPLKYFLWSKKSLKSSCHRSSEFRQVDAYKSTHWQKRVSSCEPERFYLSNVNSFCSKGKYHL